MNHDKNETLLKCIILIINGEMELKSSSGSDENIAQSSIIDVYYVSRFGPCKKQPRRESLIPEAKPLTNIQKLKLVQKLLTDIKFVLNFEEDILQEQGMYWLFLTDIVCPEQRKKIKEELETHCLTPIKWLSNSEIEIIIDPSKRIIKKKDKI